MALVKTRYSIWSGGTLRDDEPRPRRPWIVLLAALLLLILVDLLLAIALPDPLEAPVQRFGSAQEMKHYLQRVSEDGANAWLILGDSVMVGDSIRDIVPDWDQHRVIDYLRRLQGPQSTSVFHQAALNGMLPVDMLQVLRALDTADPRGHVGLLVELNLRYFSEDYAYQDHCTRPWLDGLLPDLYTEGKLDAAAWLKADLDAGGNWLREHLPILRHRGAFPTLAALTALPSLALAPAPGGRGTPASGSDALDTGVEMEVRMLEHYRAPVLLGNYAQERALRELVRRLRNSGRRALFFTTPLQDTLFGSVMDDARYGEVLARLDELVRVDDDGTVRLVHLDHPLFANTMFKDVAHLLPEGNRLLALNLIHALALPLAALPPRQDLVYPEGPDQTLVWNLDGHKNDGPPWLAGFNEPQGMTCGAPDRLIIADTGNHCIRELRQPFGTVRTLAGRSGIAGTRDGRADEALLDRPVSPCVIEDDVYFTDSGGARLRRISKGLVLTVHAPPDSPLGRAQQLGPLRCRGPILYATADGDRIISYDTRSGHAAVVVEGGAHGGIHTFDVTIDGRVFFTDPGNRIWSGSLVDPLDDSRFHKEVFPNTGSEVFPEEGFYPFEFDDVHLSNIQDLRYLPRYDALLVQDEFQPEHEVDLLDDLVHFRVLDLRRRHVLPWVRTLISGAYAPYNHPAGTYASPFRRGCLALPTDSSSWYYLERGRARLLQLEDGLWAAAKVGQTNGQVPNAPHRNLFGDFTGPYVYFNYRPDRFIEERSLPLKRRGPYIGMVLGSSVLGTSETFPDYSLGRALERDLQRMLGLQDNIQFDLIVRAAAGRRLDEAVDDFEHFVEGGGRADVVLIEALNIYKIPTDTNLDELFSRLAAAAEQHETLVLFFNLFPLGAMQVEGPTPLNAIRRDTVDAIRAYGFRLIDASNEMIRDGLDIYPWNNPPYEHHHASPWAMERTAEIYAGRLYPLLRDHFDQRAPALFSTVTLLEAPQDALRTVFDWFALDWAALDLPKVPERAVQRRFRHRDLVLLVDLSKLPGYAGDLAEEYARLIALSMLRSELLENLGSWRATTASVLLATFANYDEYGEGVQESAQVVYRLDIDAPKFRAFIEETMGVEAATSLPQGETPDTAPAEEP